MRLNEALSTQRLFCVYALSPNAKGGLDKIPVHPTLGHPIGAAECLLLPHEAELYVEALNLCPLGITGRTVLRYGVGFVLTPGCGYAFIDLDKCRDANGWQPHVAYFEALFPGAYFETSVSGNGRHVLVRYTGELPAHSNKNATYRLEFYTEGRFMAVGDIDPVGDPNTDHTAALTAFALDYFPPKAEAGDWSDAPVAEWLGPTDDDQLIAYALIARVSPFAVLGKSAKFADLWLHNVDALARLWPQAGGYDESSADQSLANHLAYFTGKNCERMLRLMMRDDCGLRRDKWGRDDYIRGTILTAIQHDAKVLKAKNYAHAVAPPSNMVIDMSVPAPPSGVPAPPGTPTPPATMPEAKEYKRGERPPSGSFVNIMQMQQVFDGYVYIEETDRIQFPDGHAINKTRFDSMLGGATFALTADASRTTHSAWEAFVGNEMHTFKRANYQSFRPDLPTSEVTTFDGDTSCNSYRPAEIRRLQGDAQPFLDFVRKLLPHGRDAELLVAYMAATTRYLGRKFTWCPFLQGTKGNGKTTIAKILQYCVSPRYTHWAKAKEIGEKYNSHVLGKILVVIDEMYSDDRTELQELLKELVTALRLEIRAMYADRVMKDVCFNMLLMSNHKNGVRIDKDERRFAPLFCDQQEKSDLTRDGLTKSYFRALYDWLDRDGYAIVYDYLLTCDIPEDFDPTKDATTAPDTTSTDEAVFASLGGLEQEIVNAVEQQRDGMRGGWLSERSVELMLATKAKGSINVGVRRKMIAACDYIPHPSLPEGVCPIPLSDGVVSRLYIKRGHAWAVDYLTPAQVHEGFTNAQAP